MDLGETMGHAEAQHLLPLAAGADHRAAAITQRVTIGLQPGVSFVKPGR